MQWTPQQSYVIGTSPDERAHGASNDKQAFAEVRWMAIGHYLKREGDNGRTPVPPGAA